MFTYKASRHYAPIEDEYETLPEALKRAASDRDSGQAYPLEIVDADGNVVLDHDGIYASLDYAPGYVPTVGMPDAVYLGATENGTKFTAPKT